MRYWVSVYTVAEAMTMVVWTGRIPVEMYRFFCLVLRIENLPLLLCISNFEDELLNDTLPLAARVRRQCAIMGDVFCFSLSYYKINVYFMLLSEERNRS